MIVRPVSFLVLSLCMAGAPSLRADAPASVERAIRSAIEQRLGADVQVIVERLETLTTYEADNLIAMPVPGARLGGVVSFVLLAPARSGSGVVAGRVGHATATIRVVVEHLVARRMIPAGAVLSGDDVQTVVGEVRDVPLRPLPRAGDVASARARRPIAAGELLTSTTLAVAPTVRAGEKVRAIANVGGASATAQLVAAENGERGALIRVVNETTRRQLRARVIGPGAVEVTHE